MSGLRYGCSVHGWRRHCEPWCTQRAILERCPWPAHPRLGPARHVGRRRCDHTERAEAATGYVMPGAAPPTTPGDDYAITVTVRNLGNATITGIGLFYYASGQQIPDAQLDNEPHDLLVPPGQSATYDDHCRAPAGTDAISVATEVALRGTGLSTADSPIWQGPIG